MTEFIKLTASTFKIGEHTFTVGKCEKARSYLKKHLHEMLDALHISYTAKEVNTTLCQRLEAFLLGGAPATTAGTASAPALSSSPLPTPSPNAPYLSKKGLHFRGKVFSLDNCDAFSKLKITKDDLKQVASVLHVPSSGTKKSICEALKKKLSLGSTPSASASPVVPKPVPAGKKITTPPSIASRIMVDDKVISLTDLAKLELSVLKHIAKQIKTSISNDKDTLVLRIRKKYKGENVKISSTVSVTQKPKKPKVVKPKTVMGTTKAKGKKKTVTMAEPVVASPSPPKQAPSTTAQLPKTMTEDEIRQAIRKCLELA